MKQRIIQGLLTAWTVVAVGCGGGSSSNSANVRACNAFRVINGHECTSDALPVVELEFADGRICTGTFITDDVVLTAAHCVDIPMGTTIRHARGSETARGLVHHPRYPTARLGAPFDLGLVYAPPGMASRLGLRPAQFLVSREIQPGDRVSVVGFGDDGYPELENGNPRAVELLVDAANARMFIAEFDDNNAGTCFGDSGAAVTFNGLIVGTVHGGTGGCADGNTNLFVSTQSQSSLDFLLEYAPGIVLR